MMQEELPQPMDPNQQLDDVPIPIPITFEEAIESRAGMSFADDVFQNVRNRWGFSLNAYEAYTTDLAMQARSREASAITAFMPRVFINLGKRKSKLNADAGAGYRFYHADADLASWDYSASATYSYDLSKRTRFQLRDQFTSSYNDSWSFLSLNTPLHYYDFSSSNEVLFNRQRITRNSMLAELSRKFGSKIGLGVFGVYRIYDFSENTLSNTDVIEAGGSLDFQITRWLDLSSSYAGYLDKGDDSVRDIQIHRLQIGRLGFNLTSSWRFWAGGGLEYSDWAGQGRFRESIGSGLGYTSLDQSFSLTYQRGFTAAIGLSRLLNSDIVAAEYGYRVNRRVRTSLQAYYYRSSETAAGGLLETLSGGGGLEFALRRDLSLTMNAYYQNQQTSDFPVAGLGLNRFTGYVGLQYVWPARRRSED